MIKSSDNYTQHHSNLFLNEKFGGLTSEEEIKTLYRKLALHMHPDKGGNTEQFNELTRVYKYHLHNKTLLSKEKHYTSLTINLPIFYLYFHREYSFIHKKKYYSIDENKIHKLIHTEEQTINIKITNDKIIIPNKGHQYSYQTMNIITDIVLNITFNFPPNYNKIKDNLIIKLNIPLLTYLTGFNNYKLTIEEKEIIINSPPLLNKQFYVVNNNGFIINKNKRGDIILLLKVIIPPNYSKLVNLLKPLLESSV